MPQSPLLEALWCWDESSNTRSQRTCSRLTGLRPPRRHYGHSHIGTKNPVGVTSLCLKTSEASASGCCCSVSTRVCRVHLGTPISLHFSQSTHYWLQQVGLPLIGLVDLSFCCSVCTLGREIFFSHQSSLVASYAGLQQCILKFWLFYNPTIVFPPSSLLPAPPHLPPCPSLLHTHSSSIALQKKASLGYQPSMA